VDVRPGVDRLRGRLLDAARVQHLVLAGAVHATTERLFRGALENAWDDGWYDEQFASLP